MGDDIYTEFESYNAEIYQQAIKRFGLRRYATYLGLITDPNCTKEEKKKSGEESTSFYACLGEIEANDAKYVQLKILRNEYIASGGRLYKAAFRRQFFGTRKELEANAFEEAKMKFGFEAYEKLMVLNRQKRKTEAENKECSEGLALFRTLNKILSNSFEERLRERERRMQQKKQEKTLAEMKKLEERLARAAIFKERLKNKIGHPNQNE